MLVWERVTKWGKKMEFGGKRNGLEAGGGDEKEL
jgi:hypothetical protein